MELVSKIRTNLIAYIRTNQTVARELHVALRYRNTSAMRPTLVGRSRTTRSAYVLCVWLTLVCVS
jgi:hypothetical protein